MPLTLTLQSNINIPVEVDQLQMDTVRNQTLKQVEKTEVFQGNQKCHLADFFKVKGSAKKDSRIIWEGNCEKVKGIGSQLSGGTMVISGNAGMHTGARMKDGSIQVEGDASDWLGAEMKGGRISVQGSAGNFIGSSYRGSLKGMTGGEILVHGNGGEETGHSMRRGLIAIGGNSGNYPGLNMIAGSIFLFGKSGIRPGAGMKRGTICFFDSKNPPELLPTFKYSSTVKPLFMVLYLKELMEKGFPVEPDCLSAGFSRYNGDFLETGLGEILVRQEH